MNIDLEDLLQKEESTNKQISFSEIKDNITNYISFLWSKKWNIVAAAIVGAIIGVIQAYTYKPTYTASYKFSIESKSSSASGLNALNLIAGVSSSSGTFSGDNLVELFRSRSMVEMALLKPIVVNGDSISLIEYKILVDSTRLKCKEENIKANEPTICDIYFPYGQCREHFSRAQDSILMRYASNLMQKDIEIEKVDKKLSYATFSVRSKNETFAKELRTSRTPIAFAVFLRSSILSVKTAFISS